LADIVGRDFRSAHLFTTRLSAQVEFREDGSARLTEGKSVHAQAPSASHDRTRRRLIDPRSPWLHALGVTSAQGKVAKGMEPKFRQINKFVEILKPLLDEVYPHQPEAASASQSTIRNPAPPIDF